MAYKKKLNARQKKALDEYKAMLRSRQVKIGLESGGGNHYSHVDVHVDKRAEARLQEDPVPEDQKKLGLSEFYLDSKKCTIIKQRPNGAYLYLWEKNGEKGNSDAVFPLTLHHPYLEFRVLKGDDFIKEHATGHEYHCGSDVYAVKNGQVFYKNYRYLSSAERMAEKIPEVFDKKISVII